MNNQKASLSKLLAHVTKPWKSEMHKADRHDRLHSYAHFYVPSDRRTIRDAVFKHLEAAYNKASSNGKYWANARQIFYAIRPMIQNEVDADKLEAKYITGVLLKDYIEQHSPGWRIAWDARGHFEEPHTKKKIGVGGQDVEKYLRGIITEIPKESFYTLKRVIPTHGPVNRFGSILFIEKEGFDEILTEAKIGKKFDMAIISTKGIPVKAACDLLCRLEADTRIFVLHDFDKSGFTILKTLQEGTRLAHGCNVIDLGLRLEDVKGLESEDVSENTNGYQARRHLQRCGATKEEINFLISEPDDCRGWSGNRVELNTMMTEDFIEWLENKLKKNKVEKIIPNEKDLKATYRRAILGLKMEAFSEKEMKKAKKYEVPEDLKSQVKKRLKLNPASSWDRVVWTLASGKSLKDEIFDDDDDENIEDDYDDDEDNDSEDNEESDDEK